MLCWGFYFCLFDFVPFGRELTKSSTVSHSSLKNKAGKTLSMRRKTEGGTEERAEVFCEALQLQKEKKGRKKRRKAHWSKHLVADGRPTQVS